MGSEKATSVMRTYRNISFLILIGRFATLDEWSIRASHPCTHLMIMEAPLRLAVD